MRPPWKFLIYVFAAGVLFFNAITYAESVTKTEKIKIASAYCVDNEWTFRIYDGVSGKTFPLRLARPNGFGWKLESFDEFTQTAIVRTPRGNFEIKMRDASLASEASDELLESFELLFKTISSVNTKNTVNRGYILKMIK